MSTLNHFAVEHFDLIGDDCSIVSGGETSLFNRVIEEWPDPKSGSNKNNIEKMITLIVPASMAIARDDCDLN
jgi:hypothetical protein